MPQHPDDQITHPAVDHLDVGWGIFTRYTCVKRDTFFYFTVVITQLLPKTFDHTGYTGYKIQMMNRGMGNLIIWMLVGLFISGITIT